MSGFSFSHPPSRFLLLGLMAVLALLNISNLSSAQDQSQLSLDYYYKTCLEAEKIVRAEMECAVGEDPRNAAAILRLHFHDCFVQGCDGSVLLDDTVILKGEKEAAQNLNSLIGFDLVDKRMEFTKSVVNETLRLGNIAPFNLKRATADTEFEDFVIPKGSTVMLHMTVVHLDPLHYEDPRNFNPWR